MVKTALRLFACSCIMIMYAIILREVIFIVSVELPTIILGPLELFLSELHTHIQCSLLLSSYHFLYAIQVKKQNCLYFVQRNMSSNWICLITFCILSKLLCSLYFAQLSSTCYFSMKQYAWVF